VAVLAGVTTSNMRRVLAGGSETVMAGVAGSNNLRVINGYHRREHIRRMAVFTEIRRLNVCRVLSGCVGTVMATNAITADVQVIEIRGQPTGRAMTVVAGDTALNMGRVLASGSNAIMAGAAGPYYLGVIDCHHWYENVRVMAVLTDI